MDNSIKKTFQYKKMKNKYNLFSVGIDEIPNTLDDLYPTIFDKDSTKIGYLKK